MSSQITNIRSRLKEDARGLREVVDFECRWIVKRYGYLLAHIPETVRP